MIETVFQRHRVFCLSLILAAMTFFVFSPVLDADFVDFDDGSYVYDNSYVKQGFTHESLVWAFTDMTNANWHPLTWLSHMFDVQLYGMEPQGHHLTNLLFHLAAVVVLFLWLSRMTGCIWRSFFVAALFAIHPLRVESVAWISERKDVLSGMFGLLALWAYWHYTCKPGWQRMMVVSVLLLIGLMCKSMLVTLPFTMLLLDWWPLNRLTSTDNTLLRQGLRLILEKWPLFLLSFSFCVLAYLSQQTGGAIVSTSAIPLPLRLSNAMIAYWQYLYAMVYPVHLAVFYPYTAISIPGGVAAAVGLAGLTGIVWKYRKQTPCLLTGWLWFIGMMIPVIGIVQIGNQSHADRYTYLTSIGLTIALVWFIADKFCSGKQVSWVMAVLAAMVLSALGILTCKQSTLWQNSLSLFTHTLKVTRNNWAIEQNYAVALHKAGRLDEAIEHATRSMGLGNQTPQVQALLGALFIEKKNPQKAILCLQAALNNHYRNPLELMYNMGSAYEQLNDYPQAEQWFKKALEESPNQIKTLKALSDIYKKQGLFTQSLHLWQDLLRQNPQSVKWLCAVAWELAVTPDPNTSNPSQAIQYARQAETYAKTDSLLVCETLAAAYARAGDFKSALEFQTKALILAEQKAIDSDVLKDMHKRKHRYEQNQPWIEPQNDT